MSSPEDAKLQELQKEYRAMQAEFAAAQAINDYPALARLKEQMGKLQQKLQHQRQFALTCRQLIELEQLRKQQSQDRKALQVHYKKLKAKAQLQYDKQRKQEQAEYLEAKVRIGSLQATIEGNMASELNIEQLACSNPSAEYQQFHRKEQEYSRLKKYAEAEDFRKKKEGALKKDLDKLTRQKNVQIRIRLQQLEQRYRDVLTSLSNRFKGTLGSLEEEYCSRLEALEHKQQDMLIQFNYRHGKERTVDSEWCLRAK